MKRRVRRFADGGDVSGYEEDPKPGDNRREIAARRKAKRDPSARKMSGMEFLSEYERSAPSKQMKDEAEKAVAKPKSSIKPYGGEYEETREVMSNLTPEQKKDALEEGVTGLALEGLGAAQIPLRLKQMIRARKIAKANESARAADKAGEAARRGMSRRDIPSSTDQYRARVQGAEERDGGRDLYGAAGRYKLSNLERIPDWKGEPWKKGGRIKGYKAGGSVQSKASSRGDGIAKRGKTRGRMY